MKILGVPFGTVGYVKQKVEEVLCAEDSYTTELASKLSRFHGDPQTGLLLLRQGYAPRSQYLARTVGTLGEDFATTENEIHPYIEFTRNIVKVVESLINPTQTYKEDLIALVREYNQIPKEQTDEQILHQYPVIRNKILEECGFDINMEKLFKFELSEADESGLFCFFVFVFLFLFLFLFCFLPNFSSNRTISNELVVS